MQSSTLRSRFPSTRQSLAWHSTEKCSLPVIFSFLQLSYSALSAATIATELDSIAQNLILTLRIQAFILLLGTFRSYLALESISSRSAPIQTYKSLALELATCLGRRQQPCQNCGPVPTRVHFGASPPASAQLLPPFLCTSNQRTVAAHNNAAQRTALILTASTTATKADQPVSS